MSSALAVGQTWHGMPTSTAGYRGGTVLSGRTSMPTSITLGNVSLIGTARWAGVN